MSRTPDKWFAMRTDYFGRDSYELGFQTLSAPASGLFVASVAYVSRWGLDAVPPGFARMTGIKRAKPVIDELASEGFWYPEGGAYYVAHEGTLWRRGDGRQRRSISPAVRAFVMKRDNYACTACGRGSFLTLDHIWPYSKGGTDDASNLRVLCRSCNSSKGDRTDGP